MRYGDDFVLFVKNNSEAQNAQKLATEWLISNLYLRVHHTNNVILPAKSGLHFLGHIIYPCSPLSVDRAMMRKIQGGVNYSNTASYQAMSLPYRFARRMPWHIVSGFVDDQ